MPKLMNKAARDKRKIRQLERDIKKMQRDFDRTFSVMDEKPKKSRKGSVISAIIAAVVLIIVMLIFLGQDGFASAYEMIALYFVSQN